MRFEKKIISVGVEKISTLRISKNKTIFPRVLFLHGAGQAHKNLSEPLAMALSQHNLSTLSFDFSGHGESTQNIPSSLAKRVSEALEIVQYFKAPIDTICAFSMGGYIALHLLSSLRIKRLILFAPAIYHHGALSIPFGPKFSQIIRQNKSWMQSDSQKLLSLYQGDILILIGEDDVVVSREVINLILRQATRAKRKKVIVLPKVGHRIALAMNQRKELLEKIINHLTEFIFENERE